MRRATVLGVAAALAAASCAREDAMTDDLELAAEVREELASEGLSTQVSVTALDGVVTLSGRVANDADRRRAESATREIDGVDDVRNRLEVGLTPPVAAPPPPRDEPRTPPGAVNPPNE